MRGLILCLLCLIVVGGLFATNPRPADFEAEVEAQITHAIAQADPNKMQDELSAVVLTTCQLGGLACAQVLRSLMTIDVKDRVLFSTAAVSLGESDAVTCYGVLTRVMCLQP